MIQSIFSRDEKIIRKSIKRGSRMGRENGFEFCRRLRKYGALSQVPKTDLPILRYSLYSYE